MTVSLPPSPSHTGRTACALHCSRRTPLAGSHRTPDAVRLVVASVALAMLFACGHDPSEPGSRSALPVTSPLQFPIVRGPLVTRDPNPDSAYLLVTVQTADSAPHVTWTPAAVELETERGDRRTLALIPFACIQQRVPPNPSLTVFPDVFVWQSCALVSAITDRLLKPQTLSKALDTLGGRLLWTRPFALRPGAVYTVLVTPGLASTDEALRRLRAVPGVTDVYREGAEPPCVFRDPPRPACPPWQLIARVPFAYGRGGGDTLHLARGTRVRATYTDATGRTTVGDYVMP